MNRDLLRVKFLRIKKNKRCKCMVELSKMVRQRKIIFIFLP